MSKADFSNIYFIKKKLWRLFPTIFVAILVTLILDYSAKNIFDLLYVFPLLGVENVGGNLGLDYIFGSLLSLQPVLISPIGTNGPLWTLGYIVNFYLFGLLTLFVFQKVSRKLSYLLYGGFIILLAYINIEWMLCFLLWCLGALLRCYRFKSFSNALFIIGFFMCILVSNILKGDKSIVFCGVACVLLIEVVKDTNELYFPALLQHITHFLSPNTFLIYALHLPICLFIYAALFNNSNQLGSFELYIVTAVLIVTATSFFSLKLINYAFKK
jgi:peptidoglycan/LPS O-acetylase OafA/YrhL